MNRTIVSTSVLILPEQCVDVSCVNLVLPSSSSAPGDPAGLGDTGSSYIVHFCVCRQLLNEPFLRDERQDYHISSN